MYELFLCIGISVMGCGSIHVTKFETKQECFEALNQIRFQEKGKLSTGEDPTESLAYCRPR